MSWPKNRVRIRSAKARTAEAIRRASGIRMEVDQVGLNFAELYFAFD